MSMSIANANVNAICNSRYNWFHFHLPWHADTFRNLDEHPAEYECPEFSAVLIVSYKLVMKVQEIAINMNISNWHLHYQSALQISIGMSIGIRNWYFITGQINYGQYHLLYEYVICHYNIAHFTLEVRIYSASIYVFMTACDRSLTMYLLILILHNMMQSFHMNVHSMHTYFRNRFYGMNHDW